MFLLDGVGKKKVPPFLMAHIYGRIYSWHSCHPSQVLGSPNPDYKQPGEWVELEPLASQIGGSVWGLPDQGIEKRRQIYVLHI